MPIPSGTRIGAYEVVGPIGAGGMGEVYRARDHRLQREVAVKVLSDATAADPDRLSRFEREARTLAALNHPNIAAIHDIADAGTTPALIMELVEGPTLADRLSQGPLPPAEAIDVGLQIADALEAAHEQGILHRDLKPANVKVRPDGRVKVLDFGLAKAYLRTGAGPERGVAGSTATVSATAVGTIVGTAAYMSPEQARGQNADKRADIWAFGCVLFEMLTGRRAFAGESTTDILAAVVGGQPDWSALPPDLAPSLRLLLRRCLEKNSKERLRDIGDARIELRTVAEPRHERTEPLTGAEAKGRPPRTRTLMWFAAGAVTAASIAYFAAIAARPADAPARPARVAVSLPAGSTLALGRGSSVALSPDGTRLVYAGRSREGSVRLYVRPLDRYDADEIPGTDDAANPFFSPDGRWLGFVAQGRLKKVPLDGGAPVSLADVRALRGEAWTTNDEILLTPANNSGLMRILAGGRMEPFTSLGPGEMSHRWPHVLGNGSVLFTIWNDTGWEPSRIVGQRSGSSAREVVVESGGGYARYLGDASTGGGYLVFARSEGLLAAPFDTSTLRLTAQPVPVVDGVVTNLSGGAHFDVADNGTLAYVPGSSLEAERDLVWVTLDGKVTPARRVNMGRYFTLSPDGTRLLRVNTIGPRDLWIDDLTRGTSTRLTDTADIFTGIWSPDATSVVFSKGTPTADLYRRRIDRAGTNERLTTSGRNPLATSFSPDGAWLAYHEPDPITAWDIWTLAVPGASGTSAAASAPRAQPFVKTRFNEGGAMFSPDGRWIAYQSNESGRFEIYVRSFPDGARVMQVSTEGGFTPAWSPRGREILYRGLNGMLMAVPIAFATELQVGTPRALFDARPFDDDFEVAADGQRLLMMRGIDTETAATVIHVVLNFLSELRQRDW